MVKTVFILIILLLASPVLAAQIEIASLPFTITTDHNQDTLYMSGNLSATGTGITVNASVYGFYFRGKGDTITFNTGSNTSVYGMHFSTTQANRAHDFKVDSLTIIESGDAGEWVAGFYIVAIYNAQFYDCNAHVKSNNSMCLTSDNGDSPTQSYNVEVKGGNYTSYVDGFDNRCQNKACAIKLVYADEGTGDYNFWVHDVTIDSCPHVGINCAGKSYIDSNTVWGNAHNDTYGPQGEQGCFSADNPYQVAFSACMAGSHAYGNTIRARSSYEGARGIMVAGAHGTAESPIEIAYNDIRVNNGPSDYTEAAPLCVGIRLREDSDTPAWYVLRYINVYENYVEVNADTASSTTHINKIGIAFKGSNWVDSTHDISVYNNTFIAMIDTTLCGDSLATAIPFSADGYSTGTNLKSYDNHFKSNNCVVGLQGEGPNAGTGNWLLERDTLEWISPFWANRWSRKGIVLIGFNTSIAIDNIIRDPIYIGYDGDLDSNAIHNGGSGTKEVTHEKTLTIIVNGNDALPVEDAEVLIINALATPDTVLDSTNASGQISGVVAYDYDEWIGISPGDDSVYNDFTFAANKAGDTTSGTYTVAWDRGDTTLVLSATGGNGNGGTATRIKGWRP